MGITGADVEIQHPGAPWNTVAVVWVYGEDASVPAVAAVVRDAARAIEEEGSISGTEVSFFAVDGASADFDGPYSRSERNAATLYTMSDVSLEVGVRPGGARTVSLAPNDITRLAAE